MWSILKPRPLGNIPMRRLTLFVSAMFMALFATVLVTLAPAHAQTPSEIATWAGSNIQYGGQTLERFDQPPDIDDKRYPNRYDTPCRDSVPLFYSDNLDGPAVKYADPEYNEDRYWTHIICLAEGSDGSDKSQPINATLLDFSVPKKDVSGGEPTGDDYETYIQHSIKIYPEGTDPSSIGNSSGTESISTCTGEGTIGIGWIVCPMTRWIATGMDTIFGILKSFLNVAPLSTDTDGPLYTMWNIVRNLANILFIVGFLIIIYSQITSVGISNYGLKRLLPRLIIAAILVNLSYWISAVAVDLSNILGSSLYDLLTGIGEGLQGSANTKVEIENITWQNVAGVVLSGGAAGAAAFGIVGGVFTSAGASLWLLLVSLMGVLVSALVAILLLAARQALITIFIVIAPLAFVAYLLPSTEKYFERWRFFFMTMLVLYPIFAIIFGGAQLAGMVIIYGAIDSLQTYPDNPNFFNLIILGLIVQVAPVLITPLLIKFGGSLMGRIAGVVNNPNKGLIDQTRKFSQSRHDMTKNRQLWDRDQYGNLRNRNIFAKTGRRNALREENNANKLKGWQGTAHAEYEKDPRSHEVYNQNRFNEMIKSTGEDDAKTHFEHTIVHDENVRNIYLQQRVNRDEAEAASKQAGTLYEGLKADPAIIAKGALERELGDRSRKADRDVRSFSSRESIAKQAQEKYYNSLITDNTSPGLRELAGFNEIDKHGVARVVNIAQEAEAKTYETLVQAGQRALQREEATLAELEEIIKTGTSSNAKFAHFGGDVESRSAAIRQFMDTSPMKMRQKLATELDISLDAKKGTNEGVLRSELAGALKKSGAKPFYISNTRLNQITEGTLDPIFNGDAGKAILIKETLNAKGLGTQSMVQIDRDDLQAVRDYLRANGINSLNADAQDALRSSLRTAFKDDRFKSQMDKRVIELSEIWDDLGMGPRP